MNLLLTTSIIVLFNIYPVCASRLEVQAETITAETTETTTAEIETATPGNAWYTTLPGSPDSTPKTIDDIYTLLFWILIVLVVFIVCVAFVFIFNCLM